MFRYLPIVLICILLPSLAGQIAQDRLTSDPALSKSLESLVHRLNLDAAVESQRFAVSLVDVTDEERPRYAGVNDNHMMYAASLPKIAILLAACGTAPMCVRCSRG